MRGALFHSPFGVRGGLRMIMAFASTALTAAGLFSEVNQAPVERVDGRRGQSRGSLIMEHAMKVFPVQRHQEAAYDNGGCTSSAWCGRGDRVFAEFFIIVIATPEPAHAG